MLSVGLMVLAAAANATGSVLQRKAGRDEPDSESSSLRLIRDLAHRPVWFGGVAAIMVGFLLQAAALATGPIALVQPILVVALVFTLLLAAAVFRRPLHVREWGAVVGMTVGLALVLYALRPAGGDPHATPPLLWVIGSVATLVIVALFAAVGYRSLHTRRAAYLGLATGTGFGFTACLISAITAAYNERRRDRRGVHHLADVPADRHRARVLLPAATGHAGRAPGRFPARSDPVQPCRGLRLRLRCLR